MAEEFNPRKARAKRPFPVWVDALLADVQFMEADEFGAYMKILICIWRTESLTISKDPKRLARIAGVSLRLWNSRISEAILPKLCKAKGGYSQTRVLKEASYVERQVTLQSNRKLGVKTAKPLKDNDTGKTTDVSTDVSTDDPSYNLQPTGKRDTKVSPKKPKKLAARLPDDWFLPQEWGEWAFNEFGLSDDAIRFEADKFKDYWLGIGGQKGRKLNWLATWRNWIRNSNTQNGGRNGRQKSDADDIDLQSIDTAARSL